MTYCDVTALRGLIGETRLIELTDDSRSGAMDTAVVDAAIVASSTSSIGPSFITSLRKAFMAFLVSLPKIPSKPASPTLYPRSLSSFCSSLISS